MHTNLENALKDDALNVIKTKIGPGVRFDSHRFIQVFTQCHQVEYIDALADCRDKANPFGHVHSEMAMYLRQLPSLQYLGVADSANIFGSVNENAEWRL